MVVIDSYSFGNITINGESYRKDILIYPDTSILCPWWRKSGHRLTLPDIEQMISMNPDVIIVGTGAYGLMKPEQELLDILEGKNIDTIIRPTSDAVDLFNSYAQTKHTGGCFHLTC